MAETYGFAASGEPNTTLQNAGGQTIAGYDADGNFYTTGSHSTIVIAPTINGLPDDGPDGATIVGTIANGGGSMASYRAYSLWDRFNLRWKGLNGKWNNMSWKGNGATGSQSLAQNAAEAAEGAGQMFFFVGTSVSAFQFGAAMLNGDYDLAAVTTLDVFASAVGLDGGPLGAAFATGWWLGRLSP